MKLQKNSSVNMVEVARLANVSQATVSRALHNPELVKESTRKKILEIIKETNYVYNSIAADFTRQKNSMIGLIAFTVRGSIQTGLIEGIQKEIEPTNYSLIIGNSHFDTDTERRLIKAFQEKKVAGIVVAESTNENHDLLKKVKESGIPVIMTWGMSSDPVFDYIGIDNYHAAYDMTQYLISLGHRTIGFIAGRFDKIDRVRHRFNGYKDALLSAGLPYESDLAIPTSLTALDGQTGMNHLLSLKNKPTAVFAASDVLAFGAMSAARDHGLSIPEDISICGFDDSELAPFAYPPLTTVHVPTHRMGHLAARAILKKTHHPMEDQPIHDLLKTDIIVRKSCAPPNDH
jgi:DNA-binding LacI/PurR family transcriptional regulator